MATACTLEQRQEALDLEKKRIAELKDNGADTSEIEDLLNFYQKNIDKPVRLKNKQRQFNSKFKDISKDAISRMNANNPKTKTGIKLNILSGYVDPNGKKAYKVTYPQGDKEYTIGAHAIVMDSIDAQHSDTLGNDPKSSKKHQGEVILPGSQINNVKAVEELIDSLDEMDNVGTTGEHKDHLIRMTRHLIGGMKKPIQEMNVYLSDKYAKNGGFVEFGNKEGIYLQKGFTNRTNGTDMSLIETFVHELVHGGTHYGLNNNKAQLSRQIRLLNSLRRKALDELTAEDIMGNVVINPEVEREIAEERLDYMAGENGLEEFLAMSLSNEKIFNKLKSIRLSDKKKNKTLWDAIYNAAMDFFDSAMKLMGRGERTMRGDKLMMKLVSDIGALNKEAEYIKSTGLRASIDRQLSSFEAKWVEWFDKLEVKNQDMIIEKLGKGEKLNIADKFRAAWMVIGSDKGTPILQNLLSIFGMHQEGFVQTILRHVKNADKYGNTVQNLVLAAGQVDVHREHTANMIGNTMGKAFKSRLTKARSKALYTATMVADNNPLVEAYSKNDLRDLYSDENKLGEAIGRMEVALADKLDEGDNRYMLNQAKGLADLMLTGKSSIVQRKNAKAIVMHVLMNSNTDVSKELVGEVDRLISLYALKGLDKTVKDNMSELIKNDYAGVKTVALTHLAFKTHLHKSISDSDSLNLMKNYHRETFDAQIDTRIAARDAKTEKQMYIEGYVKAEDIDNLGLGYKGDGKGLALYVSDERVVQPMNRSAMKYISDRETGQSLWQDAKSRGIDTAVFDVVQDQVNNGNAKAEKYEEAIRQGKVPVDDTRVVPVVNEYNQVVDYRTEVPMARKLKYLGLKTNTAEAIGRSQAHELDMEESAQINEVVWNTLMDDMIENAHAGTKIGSNSYEYVDISKLSDITEVKDAAGILPENIKKIMNNVKKANIQVERANKELDRSVDVSKIQSGIPANMRDYVEFSQAEDKFLLSNKLMEEIVGEDKFANMSNVKRNKLRSIFSKNIFKVRRDMLLDVFGVRNASIANLIPTNKHTRIIRKYVTKLENIWRDIIQLFHVDVIIKTLPVIRGNIISNIMYSVQSGVGLISAIKAQIEGAFALKQHLQGLDRLAVINSELMVNPNNRKLKREMAMIKNEQKMSPIKPLIDNGLYQHIVEGDLNTDASSTNNIARFLEDTLEGTPEFVQMLGNGLFVTEKTKLFRLLTKVTAYSDFIARYAQYTLGIAKEKKIYQDRNGKAMDSNQFKKLEDKMLINVRNAFISYPIPDSKVMQYLNDMGIVAFTKYSIRVQLAIKDLLKNKPLHFMLAEVAQDIGESVTGLNPSDIVESSFLRKPPSHWLYHPGVMEILGDIAEPQGLNYLGAVLKAS